MSFFLVTMKGFEKSGAELTHKILPSRQSRYIAQLNEGRVGN